MLSLVAVVGMILSGATEKQVEFIGAGGFKLRGTIAAPDQAPAGAPAVLLLPGSGPTDREGNQPPYLTTDLLKQVAAELAKSGIVSLRFDKRAAHVYAEEWPKEVEKMNAFFAWENFVGDAAAALELLRAQEGVDAKRVGILGHSEGGSIAMQLGADLPASRKPAFLVLMGTAGRNLGVIIREQVSQALRSQEAPKKVYDEYMGHVDRATKQILEKGTVPENIPMGLRPLFNQSAAKLIQSYLRIDPAKLAAQYPGPVLILNGEKDIQISAVKDAPALEKSFAARKAGSVRTVIVRGASHNFKPTTGPADPGFLGDVMPEALTAIREFVATSSK